MLLVDCRLPPGLHTIRAAAVVLKRSSETRGMTARGRIGSASWGCSKRPGYVRAAVSCAEEEGELRLCRVRPRPSPPLETAPDMGKFRRLNGTFYGESCGFRLVSLIQAGFQVGLIFREVRPGSEMASHAGLAKMTKTRQN